MVTSLADDSCNCDVIGFSGVAWLNGVKILDCANRESLDYLTAAVRGFGEVWPGARLEVLPKSAIPLRPIVVFSVDSTGKFQEPYRNPRKANCESFHDLVATAVGNYHFRWLCL